MEVLDIRIEERNISIFIGAVVVELVERGFRLEEERYYRNSIS
jgi:hypothetical protein